MGWLFMAPWLLVFGRQNPQYLSNLLQNRNIAPKLTMNCICWVENEKSCKKKSVKKLTQFYQTSLCNATSNQIWTISLQSYFSTKKYICYSLVWIHIHITTLALRPIFVFENNKRKLNLFLITSIYSGKTTIVLFHLKWPIKWFYYRQPVVFSSHFCRQPKKW